MNHRHIRKALRAGPHALPTAAFILACAVWQIKPSPDSHASCLAGLPALIEAEWSGETGAPEFLPVKRHLLVCPSCAKMYLDLLEIAELDARDQLPRPAQIPLPDLSFLEASDG